MIHRREVVWSRLCWIADSQLAAGRPLVDLAREAIGADLRLFQHRDKSHSPREKYPVARALADLAHRSGSVFLINDDIDLALAVHAAGVHLGQEDFPVADARRILGDKMLIGCSAHTVEQAERAERDGADYLGVGPIFASSTKMARSELGTDSLRQICAAVALPVYAIGGMTVERCREVRTAGAYGVAVAAALLPDIGVQVGRFLRAVQPDSFHS